MICSHTKILVVEDETLVADDLRETLNTLGYEVPGLAISGEDAIRQVEAMQPDLVLMDICLAGRMDGVEASEQIRTRFNVPIIYLTASADRVTLDRVKATCPFGYILKPFDDRILSTTIEIALSRHQAELQIQRAMKAAEATKAMVETEAKRKTQYLSSIFHELRNPLSVIQFATEILQRYGERLPAPKKQKQFQRIQDATETLTNFLEDMLTTEQTGFGKAQCSPAPMDLTSFCQKQLDTMQGSADNQYTLVFSVEGDCSNAYLDERLLWHILNNLLTNAIKYSPRGSTVELILSCHKEHFCFQIKDQGIGIPPNDQPTIFQPFHRGNNVGRIPGTGLGLAIVKQCVELHGGKITIASTVGHGTTVTLTLPR